MDSFIRTESNRDFLSIMILPPSVAIEIENGGDFATLAYIKQFQLSGLSTTDFAPDSISFRHPFSDVFFLA